MSLPYITPERFALLSPMPGDDVARLEVLAPGWLELKLTVASRWVDSRLAKRYATPFAAPFPEAVEDWVARIVTPAAFLRLGIDQTDETFGALKEDADRARSEIEEAAGAREGLFELPLRADVSATGISKGAPYIYSERSPTVWTVIQAERGRAERLAGRGTGG